MVAVAGLVGSVVACAPPAPPTQPTVEAARTGVVSTAQTQATAVAPTVSAARTEVAPTVSSAQTQVAPTVVAAQTQLAPTLAAAQATATAVAPTAQAVATHVAPTVAAAATVTTAAVGTQVAESTVKVTGVTVDSEDTRVVVENSGTRSENLRDWTLVMGPVFAVSLGNIDVPAGGSVTLHFSIGTSTPTDVYLGFGSNAAANNLNSGMRVVLVAPRDQIASVYTL
jgi:hypothetical protein